MGEDIKFDKRNYRKHNDKNKKLINKSLKECGAGRSILIDNQNEIIAGNGIYEQAKKLNIPVKVIETNGKELIAVKRTDLNTEDKKRVQLAIMDNSTSDSSEFDMDALRADFQASEINEWGFSFDEDVDYSSDDDEYQEEPEEYQRVEDIVENLPEELKDVKLKPENFEEIVSSFKPNRERIIITYPETKSEEVAKLLGLKSLEKICYTFEEILEKENI